MRPCILAFAAVLFASTTPAAAQVASGTQSLDVSRAEYESARFHPPQFDSEAFRVLAPSNDDHLARPSSRLTSGRSWRDGVLAIGPLRMDIGSSDFGHDGKPAHFAHLHLDDVRVLGGDVSGTFDGRAATIRLSWPTGN